LYIFSLLGWDRVAPEGFWPNGIVYNTYTTSRVSARGCLTTNRCGRGAGGEDLRARFGGVPTLEYLLETLGNDPVVINVHSCGEPQVRCEAAVED